MCGEGVGLHGNGMYGIHLRMYHHNEMSPESVDVCLVRARV